MRILFQSNPYNQQRQYEKCRWIYPIHLAMYATYLRNQGNEIRWDKPTAYPEQYKIITSENQIDVSFLELPHADRILTDAFNPKWQRNGNFKYRPGTYIQSAEGCVWGHCTFCVENGLPYETRPVDDVVNEIEECKALGFREIFDDSATFPTGRWLDEFLCKFDGSISISCNMRMVDIDYLRLKEKGFRMLLFGLESANQYTLDRINKGTKIEDIKYIIKASKYGLEPHISCMFGYPWETDEDAINTLKLIWWLLKKGYAKTAQASFYDPPDKITNSCHKKYVRRIYDVWKFPQFWFNQLKDIKDKNDLKYLWKKIKTGLWQ